MPKQVEKEKVLDNLTKLESEFAKRLSDEGQSRRFQDQRERLEGACPVSSFWKQKNEVRN
jgi:hypothetical protein